MSAAVAEAADESEVDAAAADFGSIAATDMSIGIHYETNPNL